MRSARARPVFALHQRDEAASRDVAHEVHARLCTRLEQRAPSRGSARRRAANPSPSFRPRIWSISTNQADERHAPREQPLEMLVDRHLAGQQRERAGVARGKHTRALQRAHDIVRPAPIADGSARARRSRSRRRAAVRRTRQAAPRSAARLEVGFDAWIGAVSANSDARARGERVRRPARHHDVHHGAPHDALDPGRGPATGMDTSVRRRGETRRAARASGVVGATAIDCANRNRCASARCRREAGGAASTGMRRVALARASSSGSRRGRQLRRTADEPSPARTRCPMSLTTLKSTAALDALGDHLRSARSAMSWIARRNCAFTGSSRDARDEMLVGLHEFGAQLRPQAQAREALAQVVDGDRGSPSSDRACSDVVHRRENRESGGPR